MARNIWYQTNPTGFQWLEANGYSDLYNSAIDSGVGVFGASLSVVGTEILEALPDWAKAAEYFKDFLQHNYLCLSAAKGLQSAGLLIEATVDDVEDSPSLVAWLLDNASPGIFPEAPELRQQVKSMADWLDPNGWDFVNGSPIPTVYDYQERGFTWISANWPGTRLNIIHVPFADVITQELTHA